VVVYSGAGALPATVRLVTTGSADAAG
jgi:hypothetical protein